MAISHTYEFSARDLARVLVPPLFPLGLFALTMHLGVSLSLLPPPCPALDSDRTILLHQAEASRKLQRADLLMIGDSSCLMDVSARQLSQALPGSPATLNLGTLSYLDLNAFATVLTHFNQANPHPPKAVLLLMHPEALRRPSAADYYVAVLSHFYSGKDYCGPNVPTAFCALGVETFRGRLLSRGMPQPLTGSFGREYGFSHDLWDYLSANQGSALDPRHFDPAAAQGNAEYRLASSLQNASRAFHAALPRGTKLLVGLTPVPVSFANPGYAEVRAQLLETWSKWLEADGLLEPLPATMPDDLFASTTHLNRKGVVEFSSQLSRALAKRLGP